MTNKSFEQLEAEVLAEYPLPWHAFHAVMFKDMWSVNNEMCDVIVAQETTGLSEVIMRYLASCPAKIAEQREEIAKLQSDLDIFMRLDREAATHVESVIVMRTGFTGESLYVGWKGLGLALTEALDERDALREENQKLKQDAAEDALCSVASEGQADE